MTAAPMSASRRRKYAPRLPLEERRQQLLDAALRVIVERDHFNVTMDEVAAAAGVTKPVVYGAFGTREELLQGLLQREQEQASAQVLAALPDIAQRDSHGSPPGRRDHPGRPGEDPVDLIVSALRALVAAVEQKPDRWRCILLPPQGTPRAVRAAIETNRELVRERIETVAAWCLEELGLPPSVDAELTSHAVLSLVETGGRLLLTDPRRFHAQRIVDAVTALLRSVVDRDGAARIR